MSQKPFEKKIEEMQKKQAEYKAREKQYRARQNQAERKARTKRLIEIGGAVESVLGRSIEKDDLPKLIHFLKAQEDRGGWFTKAMEDK